MTEKKKIFFVGKTITNDYEDFLEEKKNFRVVKSLSKQVSILVYVEGSRGAKTQLEKCKDWPNIQKITYDKFIQDNYDKSIAENTKIESAFSSIPNDSDESEKIQSDSDSDDDNNHTPFMSPEHLGHPKCTFGKTPEQREKIIREHVHDSINQFVFNAQSISFFNKHIVKCQKDNNELEKNIRIYIGHQFDDILRKIKNDL